MSSLQIHKSRRPGDDPVKRARAVWKLCALTMNFFIPNVEEFFETILSLFNQSNACLELRDGDQAEFLSRRLEQYEQTLRVMYQRLTETRPRQEAIRHDVEQLMNALRQLLVRLESLYCHNNDENEYETNITGSNDGASRFSLLSAAIVFPYVFPPIHVDQACEQEATHQAFLIYKLGELGMKMFATETLKYLLSL